MEMGGTGMTYFFPDAGEDDEECDEDGGEGDVDDAVAHVPDHGRPVGAGVEGGAAVAASERVEPTLQHCPRLFCRTAETRQQREINNGIKQFIRIIIKLLITY